jgi:hypothetical protein
MTEVAAAPSRPAKATKPATQSDAVLSATAPVQKREPPKPSLKLGDFSESQYAFLDASAKIPADMPFEEVFRPAFWGNVVHLFKKDAIGGGADRAGAIIHLRTEDHSFYARLYVRAVLERGLLVQCVGPSIDPRTGKACPVDLATGGPWTGPTALGIDNFDLRWNSTKRGFDIVRRSDLQVVADGRNFPTRELAVEWIEKTAGAN